MAIKYKLLITPRAEQDMDEILTYISENLKNKKASADLYDKFVNFFENAQQFPLAAPVSSLALPVEVRKLIIENYIAFYMVNSTEESISVLRCVLQEAICPDYSNR